MLTEGGVGRRNCAGGTRRLFAGASAAERDSESSRSSSSASDCIDDQSCASSLASFLRGREFTFSAAHSSRLDVEELYMITQKRVQSQLKSSHALAGHVGTVARALE